MEEAHVLHAVWAIGPGQGACPPAGRHAGGVPLGGMGLALCVFCKVPGGGAVTRVEGQVLFTFPRARAKGDPLNYGAKQNLELCGYSYPKGNVPVIPCLINN